MGVWYDWLQIRRERKINLDIDVKQQLSKIIRNWAVIVSNFSHNSRKTDFSTANLLKCPIQNCLLIEI